jgi:hypothetical protein
VRVVVETHDHNLRAAVKRAVYGPDELHLKEYFPRFYPRSFHELDLSVDEPCHGDRVEGRFERAGVACLENGRPFRVDGHFRIHVRLQRLPEVCVNW